MQRCENSCNVVRTVAAVVNKLSACTASGSRLMLSNLKVMLPRIGWERGPRFAVHAVVCTGT